MAILAVTYNPATGAYVAMTLTATQLADGSVTSAKIAAVAVGTPHIANQSITSALIAANAIGGIHILDGSIVSGDIAAAAIGGGHIANQGLISANFGANIIATPHIANQGILSASIGANIIAAPHILNQGLLSANYGATTIGGAHIANQGLTSANYAANSIFGVHVAAFGITSGKYASGSIDSNSLASGISVDISEIGQDNNWKAAGAITAFLAIQFKTSGYFDYAQAYNISSMPALGLVTAAIASGDPGTFQHKGRLANAGWDFSGYPGCLLFVGTSSEVTLMVSGLMISGACVQRVGKVIGADTIFVNPDMLFAQIAG